MTATMAAAEWVPAQEKQPQAIDFRSIKTQPKGYKERNKRKLEEQYEAQAPALEEDVGPSGMDLDGGSGSAQASKRRKADGVSYVPVYEKKPSLVKSERSSKTMKPVIRTSWERKMKEKALKKQYGELKAASAAEAKERKRADAQHRREVKERKAANREKSQVVQVVSSTTAKRMMKNRKQKKLLKKADTNPKG